MKSVISITHNVVSNQYPTASTNLGDNGTLLSGALDRSILAWEYSHADNSHSVLYECRGHTGGVESISLNATGDKFASGSADATIKIWTTIIPTVSDHIEDVTETRKKRKTVKEDRILKVSDPNDTRGRAGALF